MTNLKKRGLSPVVATTLLVSITLVLAVIIFFWARSFISETIEKNGRTVDMSCEDVDFFTEIRDGKLFMQNIGSVAIYAIEIRVEGNGEINEIGQADTTIGAGESGEFNLPEGINVGDTIIAVPILLGETDTKQVSYACDIDYGVSTQYN
jgi:flagellin-like protein